jgi:ADP-ribose pyrophosphatase YjhB (NUDIX family)
MTFVVTPTFRHFLLLLKPEDHKNPLFRGNWTAPGGKVEQAESARLGAARELKEETGIEVDAQNLRFVLAFSCNCDPTESEHEVYVYGAVVPLTQLNRARGLTDEPVRIFKEVPGNVVWHTGPLLELVIGRLKQPKAAVTRKDGG